ncbi:unnamed protein product [Closterium sp. NIES-54]
MIHAATPHFLWPFAVQYAAHQINLQPRVSLAETTPTLRWMGKVGDASAFRVWGSRAFVRDTTADKLSSRAVPCVFLGFPPDAPGWQFYHPTSRRVLSSQDVTFDESVLYYRRRGRGRRGGHRGRRDRGRHGDRRGRGRRGGRRGRGRRGHRAAVAARMRVEPGGAASWGAEPVLAECGGSPGVPLRREPLSPQRLREWYARRCRRATGAAGAGAAGGAAGAGAARGTAGARAAGATGGAAGAGAAGGAAGAHAAGGAAGAGAAGPGGARTGGTGAAGAGGAAGVGAAGAGAGGAAGVIVGDPGAEGTDAVSAVPGGAARPRPYYVPLLQQVLGLHPSSGPTPPLLSPPPVQSQSQLQPASPLHGPSPYSRPTRGLTERREPESRPVSPESRCESPVPLFAVVVVVSLCRLLLRPSFLTVRTQTLTLTPFLCPSDSLHAASPTVTRFLATAVTDPLFESTAASALVAELVDFAAACRLDYATNLVAESASVSVCPLFVGGECALGTDVLEDRQEDFECFAATVPHLVSMLLAPEGDPNAPDIPTPCSYGEAIEGPYSSQWQAAMDAKMASWKSTGTYVDEFPPPGSNIGVDFFHTFSPTPKMTTLRVLLHVAAHRDYELHSLDFSTAFLQGSLHEEIWLRRPPRFTGSFPAGTQAQCTITWTRSHMVQQVLQCFSFMNSSPQSTPLPTGHSLSAAPSDESVEPTGPYPELVGCLTYLMTCTRPDLAYPLSLVARYVAPGRHRKYVGRLVLGGRARVVLIGHADASWVDDLATQRSSQGYTFSLGSGSVSWRSTRSSSVLSSSCEAEIYAGAMAAQELRWLTYLLTDLGEAPRSPPVLYVDNNAMLALCQEHRVGHRTKHIVCATSLLESCSSVVSFVSLTWPQRPTLLMFSPRHFSLVIISVSVLF